MTLVSVGLFLIPHPLMTEPMHRIKELGYALAQGGDLVGLKAIIGERGCEELLKPEHRAPIIQHYGYSSGNNALFEAVRHGVPDVVQYLAEFLPLLTDVNAAGCSVLTVAVGYRSPFLEFLIEKLIEAGKLAAMLQCVGDDKHTVLHKIALRPPRTSILASMKKAVGDKVWQKVIALQDERGQTAADRVRHSAPLRTGIINLLLPSSTVRLVGVHRSVGVVFLMLASHAEHARPAVQAAKGSPPPCKGPRRR